MNILITGASGFVGKYFIDFFLKNNFNVFSIGRSDVKGVKNYAYHLNCNKKDLADVLLDIKPDYLFHLAGSTHSSDCIESFNINTCFGVNLLDALKISGLNKKVKCLLFGSAAEYGMVKDKDLPLSESFNCKPYTYYGIGKLAQTNYATFWAKGGGQIVIVRPFTILGKHMSEKMAVGSFIEQIKKMPTQKGDNILYTGDTHVKRDFIDVSDVIDICWRLVNLDKANGQVVNICSGRPTSLKEMIEYMVELTDTNISIQVEDNRLSKIDVKRHFGDNSKLFELLGSFEFTSWKCSIKRMLDIS